MATFKTIPFVATAGVTSGAVLELNATPTAENPAGSANPVTVDDTADDFTIGETANFMFHAYVRAANTAGTPGDSDYVELTLETDGGSGSWSGAVAVTSARAFVKTGSATICLSIGLAVTSGHMYRFSVAVTAGTYTFSTGAATIWRDDASSGAPDTAQYVTLATDAGLSNERVLTAGQGVTFADAGAGSTVTANLNFPGLTAYATPDGTIDYVAVYDDTAKAHKRVLLSDLFGASRKQQALQVGTAALAGAAGSAGPAVCVAFASHVLTEMTESEFSGTPTAAAATALSDFVSTGAWRMVGAAGARAVERAILALAHWEGFPGDPA